MEHGYEVFPPRPQPEVPHSVQAMRARGRPDDGHLSGGGYWEAAEEKQARAAAEPAKVPPAKPDLHVPSYAEALHSFLAASEHVQQRSSLFKELYELASAAAAGASRAGAQAEELPEAVAAKKALLTALAQRRALLAADGDATDATRGFDAVDEPLTESLPAMLRRALEACERAAQRTPARVIRHAGAAAAWRQQHGAAAAVPWALYHAGLAAHLSGGEGLADTSTRFFLDRLTSPAGAARLQYHIDRGNSGMVSVCDVDVAMPDSRWCGQSLRARLQQLLDAQPDIHAAVAPLRSTLPLPPPPTLAPRCDQEQPGSVTALLECRSWYADTDLRVLLLQGASGTGKSTIACRDAHAMVAAGKLPGGAYWADLRGRATRQALGCAIALALGCPELGGIDPEGCACVALRGGRSPQRSLLVLDGCERALSEPVSARDFLALLVRVQQAGGPQLRLLVTSSAALHHADARAAKLQGLRTHRVATLPLRSATDWLTAAYPPHAELTVDPALSRHHAREAAQLCGRAPLALALAQPALRATAPQQKGAAMGALLHALRVARGVRFDTAETGNGCVNCAFVNPWEHVYELFAPSIYFRSAEAAETARAEAEADALAAAARHADVMAGENAATALPQVTVAGLQPAMYDSVIKACAVYAVSCLPPGAATAAYALSVFPGAFTEPAARAVLAAARCDDQGTLQLLLSRNLLAFDPRSARYSMPQLARAAMPDLPGASSAIAAATAAFTRHYLTVLQDADRDVAAGTPAPGRYECDAEWHNMEHATSDWALAGAPDAPCRADIEAMRAAQQRVLASRVPPSDRPVAPVGEDAAASMEKLRSYGDECAQGGHSDSALQAFQELLDMQRSAIGGYDLALADTHARMASVYRSQASLGEAAASLERALAIQTLSLGPDSVDSAVTLLDLADVRTKMGHFEDAKRAARRALLVLSDAHGPVHPHTASAHGCLGSIYQGEGQLASALEQHRLCLAARERSLGKESVDVANCLFNIAVVYELQDRCDEARTLLLRAAKIFSAVLGPQHEETTQALLFAARMQEVRRLEAGGDPAWKSDHQGHPWSRWDGTMNSL